MKHNDRCTVCGSEMLWGNFFNEDGDGVEGSVPGAKWDTVCEDCGHMQSQPRPVVTRSGRTATR